MIESRTTPNSRIESLGPAKICERVEEPSSKSWTMTLLSSASERASEP
jgi:hypothetical protein